MEGCKAKVQRRFRRKRGIRKRVSGTRERPRLTVFRSSKHIYAQLIDDDGGLTLCEASTRSKDLREQIGNGGNKAAAKIVGTALAERAKAKSIGEVCFDRNGYRFHGRIKALADAAREAGLVF
jgi:large subunit ribosomal protein L18